MSVLVHIPASPMRAKMRYIFSIVESFCVFGWDLFLYIS